MAINGYCTVTEYRAYNSITSTNATEDAFVEKIIAAVSRYIDRDTRRVFYPRIETRYFDVPESRTLMLDDDLLELTTLTNGDDVAITNTDYIIESRNYYPKWGIKLKETTGIIWETDSNANSGQVIDVLGVWGHHKEYGRAWITGSTLNEASNLNATDLTFTVTSGTNFAAGQVIKVDSEYMNITGVSTNDITVSKRGDNGSTAATHTNGSTVYIWDVEADIKYACLMIVDSMYKKRSGQNVSTVTTVTAGGLIITPQDIPSAAREILQSYRRLI